MMNNLNMKKIITYGTFDTLHYGHISLLERARSLGSYLIVGLSTDSFNEKKNKKSYHSWGQRKKFLESLKCVDLIIEENSWEQKISDVQKYNIDTFAIGNDWAGEFDCLSDYCEVVYLPRTEIISSSIIKSLISTHL